MQIRYALFAVVIEMMVLGLTLPVAPVFAHHSVSAEFDLSKRITLEGRVTKIEWMNPHVYLYVDVSADGKTANWACETLVQTRWRGRAGAGRRSRSAIGSRWWVIRRGTVPTWLRRAKSFWRTGAKYLSDRRTMAGRNLKQTALHIPDGYLSPATCAALYAGAAPFWYVSLQRMKRALNTQTVPLVSVFAAFSFVVMMFKS